MTPPGRPDVPASLVALVSPGETVGSLRIGAALLGQPPSVHEGAGVLLALAGVASTFAASSSRAPSLTS